VFLQANWTKCALGGKLGLGVKCIQYDGYKEICSVYEIVRRRPAIKVYISCF